MSLFALSIRQCNFAGGRDWPNACGMIRSHPSETWIPANWLAKTSMLFQQGVARNSREPSWPKPTSFRDLESTKPRWLLGERPEDFWPSGFRLTSDICIRRASLTKLDRSEEHTSELQSLMRL